MKKKPTDQFSKRESKQRFEAALRGVKIVGHKPMSEIPKLRDTRKSTQTKRKTGPN